MQITLLLAAAYNVLWGTWVGLFPAHSFAVLGMPAPQPLPVWQSVGMMVAVYGVAYFFAAFAPYRYWPLVLVGLLGKVLGPLGFLFSALTGQLPWVFGVHLLFNDLLWWAPFGLILRGAYQAHLAEPDIPFADALTATVNTGETLGALSRRQPTLVVFLRHNGCPFCQELLTLLCVRRKAIQGAGIGIVLVHMGTDSQAEALVAPLGLADLPRLADPERKVYRGFGLRRGQFRQFLGFSIWWPGLRALLRGHRPGLGPLVGDPFQMPGAFLIFNEQLVHAFRAETSSDHPDFSALSQL